MVDGSALLASVFRGLIAGGSWVEGRESNLLDGGAPFYRTYRTQDGSFVAVGALEPRSLLLCSRVWKSIRPNFPTRTTAKAGKPCRHDSKQSSLPGAGPNGSRGSRAPMRVFHRSGHSPRPLEDDHLAARGTFVEIDGVPQPAPAPRFSQTPAVDTAWARIPTLREAGADTLDSRGPGIQRGRDRYAPRTESRPLRPWRSNGPAFVEHAKRNGRACGHRCDS